MCFGQPVLIPFHHTCSFLEMCPRASAGNPTRDRIPFESFKQSLQCWKNTEILMSYCISTLVSKNCPVWEVKMPFIFPIRELIINNNLYPFNDRHTVIPSVALHFQSTLYILHLYSNSFIFIYHVIWLCHLQCFCLVPLSFHQIKKKILFCFK